MAQSQSDSLTGIAPFWPKPTPNAPSEWEEWLKSFFMVADLKEKCVTRKLLADPDAVPLEPYPKPEKAPESNETTQEKMARETRNAALIIKTDAINAELKAKGPRLGNGAYYHEVYNSVKSRLYLSLGEEGRLRVNLKHPNLALENETTKTLVEKLNNMFKEEKNVTFERLKLFSREIKQNESLEYFHNALQDLAKTCELSTLKASLVKDLFIAKINNKELQMKFCREKTSPEEVLKYVILYERGTQASNNLQQITKNNVQIKQEPTFSIQQGKKTTARWTVAKRERKV